MLCVGITFTSKNAYVPLKSAKILFDVIQAGKNVVGHKIGYYTVNAINGTLKIGCHDISMKEVNLFAESMNWI